MASSMTTLNVMLAIHGKKTLPLDMYKPLRQYIVSHYSEAVAKDSEEDLTLVNTMRSSVEKQMDSLENRRDLLQQYFRTLTVMETRFPISPERDHINSLYFTWFDAFKSGKKAAQTNIHFEKAGVLFNLGATQSQLGLSADRSTAQGLKQACNSFQSAAGAFAFLRDNVSMKASSGTGGNSNSGGTTLDISVECAGMLERLLLAQAQECFYEKVSADGKPNTLCGRVARQVGLYYEEAHAALVLPPLNQQFDKTWVSHVQLKSAQFQAESLYRVALDLHEQENIAEEIARLQAALVIINEAKKMGKGVIGPLYDSVVKLEGHVTRNMETAKKENDRVYLMRVPAFQSLPPIPPANLVNPFDQRQVLDASTEKMFPGLVPDSSAKALSKYTEMVDQLIRNQAEKLQNESDLTRVRLQEMDLPDSLYYFQGGDTIPEELKNDIEMVKLDGGPGSLDGELGQLKDLRRVNEELLVQTEEILEKEAREDAQIRAQFGTRWTRPNSSTLTKTLRDRVSGFAQNLRQAAESDGRIERSVKENEPLMAILRMQPVEAALPKLSKPIVSIHGNEDAIAANLKQLLTELEKLGSQRAGLEDMLKDMKRKDDILPQLMNTSGSYDDLFKREISKYDSICLQVKKNIEAQDHLLQQIKTQSDAFAAAFNLQEHKAAREKVLKQMTSAVAKYREIKENMNEGLKFYVTLQDAITNLKQQCGDFVLTRAIQCREMMEDLQRQIAGLSLSSPSQPPNAYPPAHTPPPRPSGGGGGGGGGLLQHFSLFSRNNNNNNQQQQSPPPPPPHNQSSPPPPPPNTPSSPMYYSTEQQQQHSSPSPPSGYYQHAPPGTSPSLPPNQFYAQQQSVPSGGYGNYGAPPTGTQGGGGGGGGGGGHWQGQYYQTGQNVPNPVQPPYQGQYPPSGYYRQG